MVTPGIAYFGNNQVLLDTNVHGQEGQGAERLADPHASRATASTCATSATPRTPTPSRPRASASTAGDQVYVPIYRQQGASSLAVANGVKDHIAYMEARLPGGDQARLRHGSVGLRHARPSTA